VRRVKWVVGPGGHRAGETCGAFAHQTKISAVYDRGANARAWPGDETFDIGPPV
jgi:hypothetical protein